MWTEILRKKGRGLAPPYLTFLFHLLKFWALSKLQIRLEEEEGPIRNRKVIHQVVPRCFAFSPLGSFWVEPEEVVSNSGKHGTFLQFFLSQFSLFINRYQNSHYILKSVFLLSHLPPFQVCSSEEKQPYSRRQLRSGRRGWYTVTVFIHVALA